MAPVASWRGLTLPSLSFVGGTKKTWMAGMPLAVTTKLEAL